MMLRGLVIAEKGRRERVESRRYRDVEGDSVKCMKARESEI